MPHTSKPPVLYINGLGNGETSTKQRLALANLNWRGFEFWHAHLDWQSEATFQEHLDKTTALAEGLLTAKGSLAIIGSSAGASMAVNTFANLAPKYNDLWAITLCGRTAVGKLPGWDWRTMDWAAHTGKPTESKAFKDSVEHCESVAMPGLNPDEKQRILMFHQLFDFVVPHSTQFKDDVPNKRLPVIGHGLGIFVAGWLSPGVIKHQIRS